MRLQPNRDPIVQILMLAARRGFQIMAEREQTEDTNAIKHDVPGDDQRNGGEKLKTSRSVPSKDSRNARTSS
jgi:hypothetical protein